VVISIIAVLAAITTGVFARVRAGQLKSATDATLSKINSLIERRWKAVNDQVADDVKNNHPGYSAVLGAVQNPDLAKAVWTHAKMKSEFPTSVDEARFPVALFPGISIPPKAVFRAAFPDVTVAGAIAPFFPTPPGTFSTAATATDEAAACLYLAVTANAGGGTANDTDGIQQQIGEVTINGRPYKVFKDTWGTPITFVRTAYNAEVALPPFVRTGQPTDPFDPRSKLGIATVSWTTSGPGNSLATWWNNMRANVPAFAQVPVNYPGAVNHIPTAISAGPNKNFGADVYGLAPGDTDPGKDNAVSYRLRREGARGE
jgi:hypothetical protein